ncbi:hypothetical protein ACIA8K_27915 [Catenuloplanes sp. NPDC051500]|uniref:WXG100-like domain-containing protein n=1 Tax=Catenuloplanes sp. NPDC051500 TaxID=3363959 RepID=UPI003794E998
MGLQLPGELIWLLGELGYTWPEADEEKLFEMAGEWIAFSGTVQQAIVDGTAAAQQVWSANTGADVAAFQRVWGEEDAPAATLGTAAESSTIVGAGMYAAAGIVLALKINVIIQLTLLAIQIAQAIATAPPTFGASLLEIPILKMITGLVLDEIINQAVEALLNG